MLHPPLALWGRVLTDGHDLPPSRVEVSDGRIVAMHPADRPLPGDITVERGWIVPGLIDVQVNGAGGLDLTGASEPTSALEGVARSLAAHGVTAFCPTIVSSPVAATRERVGAYAARPIAGGATSLGAHVEGPFLDPDHRGVHDPSMLRAPSPEEAAGWLAVGPPALVTLAPELPGATAVIEQLAQAGVVVSLGHSGANAAAAHAGLAAGARFGTHLFNAMPPLHHRQPGLVGALLASQARLGIIADGVHLDPLTIDLIVGRAGVGRVALVSDALAAAGTPPGPSILGQQRLVSDGRSVRRADGTLAGSALLLDGCLRHARAWLDSLSPAAVLRMATSTPADLLGLADKGRVQVGADADLVVLDADWCVRMTLVGGQMVGSPTSPGAGGPSSQDAGGST